MKANIKVRQPLASLKLKISGTKLSNEYLELIKERVNVKEVQYGNITEEVLLDTTLSPELQEEGVVREIIRFVQDARKKEGLTPKDRINISVSSNESGGKILQNKLWQQMISDAVQANGVSLHKESRGEKLSIEGMDYMIEISRA
jgi:hypothetical protein